jgi:hypothetical protein
MLLLLVNLVWMLLLLLLQLPLQSKWTSATVCLELNTKKATFRHRLAHQHVETDRQRGFLQPSYLSIEKQAVSET